MREYSTCKGGALVLRRFLTRKPGSVWLCLHVLLVAALGLTSVLAAGLVCGLVPAAVALAAAPALPPGYLVFQGALLYINGVQVYPDVPLLVNSGRMVVPVRIIAENLGAVVTWDPVRQAASIVGGGRHIDLPVGAAQATVNGRQITLDAPAVLYSGRTMVPLRFVAEALGCEVAWNNETRAASVTAPGGGGRLLDVQLVLGPERALVQIRADRPAPWSAKTLDNPPRLVVDLEGIEPHTGWTEKSIGQALVERVRIGVMSSPLKATRVVLDLKEPVRFACRSASDFAGVVVEIQYKVSGVAWEDGGLTISGTGPLPARSFVLSGPDRYVIDLPDTNLTGGSRSVDISDGHVLRARIAQFQVNPDIVRVVLDLTKPTGFRIAQAESGLRVVPETAVPPPPVVSGPPSVSYEATPGGGRLTVSRPGAGQPVVTVSPDGRELRLYLPGCGLGAAVERQVSDGVITSYSAGPDPDGGSVVIAVLPGYVGHILTHDSGGATVSVEIHRSPVVGRKVAIDPGHGGIDPGAVSVTGKYEREINLAIAKAMRQHLERAGAQVLMTREDNTTKIGRHGRAGPANEWGAEVLVSVHCNSHTLRSSSGTEVWHLGDSAESLRLARLMNESLRGLGLVDRGVRKGEFAILKEAAMPGVLVETGFLSNPTEEKLLLSPAFQAKAGELMCQGVIAFFR